MAGRTRIIDLSVPLMNYSMDTHEQTIHYLDHAEVARQRAKTYAPLRSFVRPAKLAGAPTSASDGLRGFNSRMNSVCRMNDL